MSWWKRIVLWAFSIRVAPLRLLLPLKGSPVSAATLSPGQFCSVPFLMEDNKMSASQLANDLKQMFSEAAADAAKKRLRLEQETLTDDKVRAYFKTAVRCLADKMGNNDTTKILVGHNDCGVPHEV